MLWRFDHKRKARSFLKKEPKNFCDSAHAARLSLTLIGESLLLLFFRKEDSPS
jgi:hypothetical protein